MKNQYLTYRSRGKTVIGAAIMVLACAVAGIAVVHGDSYGMEMAYQPDLLTQTAEYVGNAATAHADNGILAAEGAAAATGATEEGRDAVDKMADKLMERMGITDEDVEPDGETRAVPEGQETPEGRDGDVRVEGPRDEDKYLQTYRLINAVWEKDDARAREVQQRAMKMGFYGDEAQRKVKKGNARDVALTSTGNDAFLPTEVSDEIEQISLQVGIFDGTDGQALATVFDIESGTLRVPGLPGAIDVSAVNEGSEIPGKDFDPESDDLRPKKWGGITGWSNEMTDEVGAQFVENLTEAVGIGFGRAVDETVLIADGTASYHGITGLFNDGNIPKYTVPGGANVDDMTYDDVLHVMEVPSPSLYANTRTVFHPSVRFTMRRFTDQGGHIFPISESLPEGEFAFTEGIQNKANTGANEVFGVAGDFSFVTIARIGGIMIDTLTEAQIKDSDGDVFNLATQDGQALRFKKRWNVSHENKRDEAFKLIETGSGSGS